MTGTVLVAVYGTLKKGLGNHGLMAQAQFLGCDKLAQICLSELDLLEEYDPAAPASSLYTRALLPTRYGLAWVYLYQGQVLGKPCLRSGTWQPLS